MPVIVSLFSGLLFGIGLLVSGMADPAKVLAFLDIAGNWDPSLALVMAGAVAVAIGPFALARRRTHSLLGLTMQLPSASAVDSRLVLGSVVFGVGWGLAGLCPGPALVLSGMGAAKALCFVAAMLVGMACFELIETRRQHTLRSAGGPGE
jgi:uncharacterized protein